MSVNILHDHLSGFDAQYFSKDLSNAPQGQVQVEYILPDSVKQLYPHLEIQFSAFLMVRNNHFEKFLNRLAPDPEERTNFLCSFNRSKHISRTNFVVQLFLNGLFNPEFCSKNFDVLPDELFNQLPEQENFSMTVSEANSFMKNRYNQGNNTSNISNGHIGRDLDDLSLLIKKSFITAVSETVADSYVPFPTEKICFPIVNKSLWIAYAQPNYYSFIDKYMGIKPYVGIDYSFDEILDPALRLALVMKELKRLQAMSVTEKADMYSLNQHLIDHNFIMVTSGEMIANLWSHDECSEHYSEIGNATKLGGFTARDIGSNLLEQMILVNRKFLEKEKRFKDFG